MTRLEALRALLNAPDPQEMPKRAHTVIWSGPSSKIVGWPRSLRQAVAQFHQKNGVVIRIAS